jgi:hypothetical protein
LRFRFAGLAGYAVAAWAMLLVSVPFLVLAALREPHPQVDAISPRRAVS